MPQHNQHHKKKKNQRKTDQNNNQVSSSGESTMSGSDDKSLDSLCTELPRVKLNGDEPVYEVKNSADIGRYLIARKDLRPAEIVMKVAPIAIGPCTDSDPVCLGCYVPIIPSRIKYKCLGCGWPMCNQRCTGLKTATGHSTWECSILRENRVADLLDKCKTIRDFIDMYEVILPLRCLLLRKHNRSTWNKLEKMESHNQIRKDIQSLWQRNQSVVVDQLRNRWGIKDFSEDEIHTVCGVIEVNCFEIGQNESRARAIYDEAYLLSHDCIPNTTHTDDPFTYDLTIRMLRDVAKGTAITLSYAYTLQGTLKRRQHLQECKFFWCKCERCCDATELGTYASAIKCPKCSSNGLILSTNPLSETAPWKCNRCNYLVTGQSMLLLVDTVFKELDDIDGSDADALESFLNKYRNVFHMNHYLCICAKHSLCQLYGRSEEYLIQNLSLELLQRKEQYCRELMSVVDKIEPGMSRLRGTIMYELHAPIMIQSTRLFEARQITNEDLRKRLVEVVNLLKESEAILSLEPKGSPEHSMSLAAKDALKRIGKV